MKLIEVFRRFGCHGFWRSEFNEFTFEEVVEALKEEKLPKLIAFFEGEIANREAGHEWTAEDILRQEG